MLSLLRPKNWWQAGLLWGSAMFLYYFAKYALRGELTLALTVKNFLVWESGGLLFGVVLTAVLSLLGGRNLFRTGFPEKRGDR